MNNKKSFASMHAQSTHNRSVICIVDDSITNPVCESQLIIPLRKQFDQITIISFERHPDHPSVMHRIKKLRNAHTNIIICKKYPLMGTISLQSHIQKLSHLLHNLSADSYYARGPIAGYCLIHAIDPNKLSCCTIQARGLLAQEYAYTHQQPSHRYIRRLWHTIRARMYHRIEQAVYTQPNITIQAVSHALGHYLIDTFGTNPQQLAYPVHDTPPAVSITQQKHYKTTIRHQLSIDQHAYVYCYNGSIKAWQKPEHIIQYVMQQPQPHKHLLIITPDQDAFVRLAAQYTIPQHMVTIVSVDHTQVYQYLCAADVGLIFRDPHIVNWVSRPTKVLEYQATGLDIIHNNTIEFLYDQSNHER